MNTRLLGVAFLALTISHNDAQADDALLVVNKDEATLSVINPMSGEELARIEIGGGPHEVAASPDGRTAVVGDYGLGDEPGNSLKVIDLESREVVRTIDLGDHKRPHDMEFLDNERVLVTTEESDRLLIVNVVSSGIEKEIPTPGGAHMFALKPGASMAYTSVGASGLVAETRLDGPTAGTRALTVNRGAEAIALSPDGREVWAGNNFEQNITVIDTETFEQVARIECGLQPIRLEFFNGGEQVLASCFLTGDIAVIDTKTRMIERRIKLSDAALDESDWKGKTQDEMREVVMASINNGGARPIGLIVAPDGFIYVAARGLDHVAVIDPASWEVVKRIPTGRGPDGLAWARIAD